MCYFHQSPLNKLLERSSVGKASPADSHILLESEVLDLMHHSLVLPVKGALCLVWFDGSHITWNAKHQLFHQLIGLGFNP